MGRWAQPKGVTHISTAAAAQSSANTIPIDTRRWVADLQNAPTLNISNRCLSSIITPQTNENSSTLQATHFFASTPAPNTHQQPTPTNGQKAAQQCDSKQPRGRTDRRGDGSHASRDNPSYYYSRLVPHSLSSLRSLAKAFWSAAWSRSSSARFTRRHSSGLSISRADSARVPSFEHRRENTTRRKRERGGQRGRVGGRSGDKRSKTRCAVKVGVAMGGAVKWSEGYSGAAAAAAAAAAASSRDH